MLTPEEVKVWMLADEGFDLDDEQVDTVHEVVVACLGSEVEAERHTALLAAGTHAVLGAYDDTSRPLGLIQAGYDGDENGVVASEIIRSDLSREEADIVRAALKNFAFMDAA